MKLVFAADDTTQSLPPQGVRRIGSAPDADIVLQAPGLLPRHCELQLGPQGVMLRVANGAEVRVNQRPVDGLIALRDGDRISFGGVEATLISGEPAPIRDRATTAPANEDIGATMVRAALPKFALRAQNGRMLGKHFALSGTTFVGRATECQLRIDEAGLSRKHAKLIPTNDGVVLEDLASTNGSYHNGQRVQHAVAKAGDEIGFDTLRFTLFEVGQDIPQPRGEGDVGIPRWVWIALGALVVAATVFFLF